MFCVLIGLVPPTESAFKHLQEHITNVQGMALQFRESSHAKDADDGDTPTLLISAASEAQPDDVVAAVDRELKAGGEETRCELWASAPCPLPLRPPCGYPVHLPNNEGWLYDAARAMREWGVLTQSSVLNTAQINELRMLVDDAIFEAEASLAANRPDISVGTDVFCFKEIASRSTERFDLRLLNSAAGEFVERHVMSQPEVAALLQQTLGSLCELNFDISVVYSRPGADHQGWHADGGHQKGAKDAGWDRDGWEDDLADAYAICLFIPLIDLNNEVGYTQLWPGSHRHRDLVGFGKVAEIAEATFDGKCLAGDAVWYDYRLLHRGMPNSSSDVVRPVVQLIFKRKWYVERQNYGTESIVKDLR
mmetsp:Transcript_37725/g.82835  ORF Transcript_37725/g.82835 Transcript_37725/m.82835 type:complete len:364 (+) Transcript_37725:120-1211(+)